MHRCFAMIMRLTLTFALCASACGSRTSADDQELVPQCANYLAEVNRCTKGVSPDVASQRAAATRQAFAIAAKDQAARDRLSAQCRAGQEQLSRACR